MSNYSNLVKEAFLDPLRSVLIVDDEYPTWEEILNSYLEGKAKSKALDKRSNAKPWRNSASGPLQVISEFRKSNPGFVIDIHDALASGLDKAEATDNETVSELATHLHQSDLLVLDYNLEGDTGLRGAKAREILHSVLSNQHFNLIIVHTGEKDLINVAEESLLPLLKSCTANYSTSDLADIGDLDEKIAEFEDVGDFNRNTLKDHFSRTHYLHARQVGYKKALGEYMQGKGCFAALHRLAEELNFQSKEKKVFLNWSICEIEKEFISELAKDELKGLFWRFTEEYKWIRTSKGFVCFIEKGPNNLLQQLKNTLVDWQPTPSRLLSAKYRHELNRIGVEAEDDALLKHHLFALFYKNIRDDGKEGLSQEQVEVARDLKIREHVTRQSEGLSFLIEDEIVEFGKKIIELDLKDGHDFLSHYNIDLSKPVEAKKATAQYNHYVSTLPSKSKPEQLDSGHIFKIGDQWWVCATPACDLQPGQNTIAFEGKSKHLRPFTAFPLVEVDPDKLEVRHINGGGYCFVENEDKIVALGIKSIGDEKKPSDLKVHWQNFLAEYGGVITNNKLNIQQLILSDGAINVDKKEAKVVSKLRYAYALNYIQRVGISTSRIGLEYVS